MTRAVQHSSVKNLGQAKAKGRGMKEEGGRGFGEGGTASVPTYERAGISFFSWPALV